LARGRIKAALRAWFEGQGFLEVEPGILQLSPGNETHLHAFKTDLVGTDLARHTRFLHTSPEFAAKKLLAAGESRIFTFAPVFRNRERSPLHHPEFTMLEWYRTNEPYQRLWDDCAEILKIAAQVTGRECWSWRQRTCHPLRKPEPLSLDAAFSAHAGIHLLDAAFRGNEPDRDRLAEAALASGIKIATDDTWSDIFARVLTERIEPALGHGTGGVSTAGPATILHAYPMSEAALARRDLADPRVAERFELYACGVELANGFGELTDADEQRARLLAEMDAKERRYGERYPIDEQFLAALSHMPPASGCALGFDRLVMLATGAARVDDVIWTPMDEA
jgi:lysyl-tRNA synthetase class 2